MLLPAVVPHLTIPILTYAAIAVLVAIKCMNEVATQVVVMVYLTIPTPSLLQWSYIKFIKWQNVLL